MTTTVRYEIPFSEEVEIILYDVNGKKIYDLYKGYQSVGLHEVEINGDQLSSGIYYYSLKTHDFQSCKKCILIK
jgi:hypothetical protein